MQTPKLVAVELPNSRFVVRVNGPRLGTIFSIGSGRCTPTVTATTGTFCFTP